MEMKDKPEPTTTKTKNPKTTGPTVYFDSFF